MRRITEKENNVTSPLWVHCMHFILDSGSPLYKVRNWSVIRKSDSIHPQTDDVHYVYVLTELVSWSSPSSARQDFHKHWGADPKLQANSSQRKWGGREFQFSEQHSLQQFTFPFPSVSTWNSWTLKKKTHKCQRRLFRSFLSEMSINLYSYIWKARGHTNANLGVRSSEIRRFHYRVIQ